MKIFKTVEIKIAIFVIIGLFLLVWGINFLQGVDIFKKQYKYYVEFERTDGLLASHSVVINGMIVGIVDNIELLHSGGKLCIVGGYDIQQGVATAPKTKNRTFIR